MNKLLLEIKEAFLNSGHTIKKREPLTDVIPRGVTVLYGRSGAGKTVSIVKHLARNKIDAILLDFDDNPPIEDVEYTHFDGKWFMNYLEVNSTPEKKLDNFISKNLFTKDKFGNDVPKIASKTMDGFERFCLPHLKEEKKEEYQRLIDDLYSSEVIKYDNEVFIIDTYHKFISLYGQEKLEEFIKDMITRNVHVIVVSHETGERGRETGIDEAFVNHCDGRMRLHYDITKTKSDIYLIVEKNRSLVGDNKIENWERD